MSELETQTKLNEILALIEGLNSQAYLQRIRNNVDNTLAIVPIVKMGGQGEASIPADRYYSHLGMAQSSAEIGYSLFGGASPSATFAQFDTATRRQYLQLANAGGAQLGNSGIGRILFPTGPFGESTSYAPKSGDATKQRLQFTARFNTNADYGATGGVGANNGTASEFSTAANRFIQVLRNVGNWELGTSDGTTISQSSVAGADGNFHEFCVLWSLTDVSLSVDGALVITKTTNLPDRPMFPMACAIGATGTIDIVDYLADWVVG